MDEVEKVKVVGKVVISAGDKKVEVSSTEILKITPKLPGKEPEHGK